MMRVTPGRGGQQLVAEAAGGAGCSGAAGGAWRQGVSGAGDRHAAGNKVGTDAMTRDAMGITPAEGAGWRLAGGS